MLIFPSVSQSFCIFPVRNEAKGIEIDLLIVMAEVLRFLDALACRKFFML
jgi:hypothetical protein